MSAKEQEKDMTIGGETAKQPKRSRKGLWIALGVVVLIVVIVSLTGKSRTDPRETAYSLIPEIMETLESEGYIGLGYEKPVYPAYGAEGVTVTDLNSAEEHDGYTFRMYRVEGTVGVTTLLGARLDMTYSVLVGLDKDYADSGVYYYSCEGGTLFDQ